MKKPKRNPPGMRQDSGKTATTRQLTRIIVYLSRVDHDYKTRIVRETGSTNQITSDALNFLCNLKIVSQIQLSKKGCMIYYKINPLFKR